MAYSQYVAFVGNPFESSDSPQDKDPQERNLHEFFWEPPTRNRSPFDLVMEYHQSSKQEPVSDAAIDTSPALVRNRYKRRQVPQSQPLPGKRPNGARRAQRSYKQIPIMIITDSPGAPAARAPRPKPARRARRGRCNCVRCVRWTVAVAGTLLLLAVFGLFYIIPRFVLAYGPEAIAVQVPGAAGASVEELTLSAPGGVAAWLFYIWSFELDLALRLRLDAAVHEPCGAPGACTVAACRFANGQIRVGVAPDGGGLSAQFLVDVGAEGTDCYACLLANTGDSISVVAHLESVTVRPWALFPIGPGDAWEGYNAAIAASFPAFTVSRV
eukprot:gnl/Chilomastix_cuspidata/4660.p1 GENE.gnl/Chilomastix_cuspidata/4660~~gnl/Chilomastix_cuspidata/4660.p1  ORF type:complete len:348 (-),score=75.91 gnl/Chilomastix_cuspidata/4660:165-1145(-)